MQQTPANKKAQSAPTLYEEVSIPSPNRIGFQITTSQTMKAESITNDPLTDRGHARLARLTAAKKRRAAIGLGADPEDEGSDSRDR